MWAWAAIPAPRLTSKLSAWSRHEVRRHARRDAIESSALPSDGFTLGIRHTSERLGILTRHSRRYGRSSAIWIRRSLSRVTNTRAATRQLACDRTISALLATAFGSLAHCWPAIGLYGSWLHCRVADAWIGIRMALGAPQSNVLWMVMKKCDLVGIGVAVGCPSPGL